MGPTTGSWRLSRVLALMAATTRAAPRLSGTCLSSTNRALSRPKTPMLSMTAADMRTSWDLPLYKTRAASPTPRRGNGVHKFDAGHEGAPATLARPRCQSSRHCNSPSALMATLSLAANGPTLAGAAFEHATTSTRQRDDAGDTNGRQVQT
jgi:hypothetical protein